MQQIKKILILFVFFIGFSSQIYGASDCMIGQLFDGGAGIGCGATLMFIGTTLILIPGTASHCFTLKTNSGFLGFCTGASYFSGLFLVVGGAKILVDGIKKFFGIKKRNIYQELTIMQR